MITDFTTENLTPLFYEEAEEKNSPMGMLSKEMAFACTRIISVDSSELFTPLLVTVLNRTTPEKRKQVLEIGLEKFMTDSVFNEEVSGAAEALHMLID